MGNLFFILFLLCTCNLYSGIEKYFKKITDKPEKACHQIENIDFIYMINLDERPEKFASCIEQLHPFNIYPYRFSAVNGWELSIEALNQLGVKYEPGMLKDLWGTCYLPYHNFEPHHEIMHVIGRNYFAHCMPRGAIGIVLSHLSVLQDAYDSGYETIWVMEDDIEVIKDPCLMSGLIETLDLVVGKGSWDILFTDQNTKDQQGNYVYCQDYARRPNYTPKNPKKSAQKRNVSSFFRLVGARYGAYSMIVRRSGMKKLLDFIKHYGIFLPIDMDFCLPMDIKLYTVTDDVVSTQPRALSDNGSPSYHIP